MMQMYVHKTLYPFYSTKKMPLVTTARYYTMIYTRGSQPGVHVPPGVHLPIRRGTFRVSSRRDQYVYISFLYKYLYIYQWIFFSKIM